MVMVRISDSCMVLFSFWCCHLSMTNPIDVRDLENRLTYKEFKLDGHLPRTGLQRKRSLRRLLHRSRHSVPENTILTESLHLRRDQACQGQRLALKCPVHTQLVIESTFFGRSVPYSDLCPPLPPSEDNRRKDGDQERSSTPSTTSLSVLSIWQERYEDLSCDVSNAHSKVMESCQYRRKCKINVNSKFFGRDPCPLTAKYLQVAYKCKPSRFGSENFCEGTTMQLSCKTNQRLAIYAASYGRTVTSNSLECLAGQPPVSYDCTIDVLQKIMQACHAQLKCSTSVNDAELGSAGCEENVKKYLNVIFICVNEEVFSDNALTGQFGSDESSYEYPAILGSVPNDRNDITATTLSTQNDASIDTAIVEHPRSFIPPVIDTPGNTALSNRSIVESKPLGAEYERSEMGLSPAPTTRCLPESVPNAIIQVQNWLSTYDYIHKNQEKFFLYFGLSSSTGIIALLLFCIVQLCWRNRGRPRDGEMHINDKYCSSRDSSKLEVTSAHSPTVFDEGRVEMTDFGRDGISFLRFNHPTPPRSHNHATTPAVSIAAATSSYPAHQFYS